MQLNDLIRRTDELMTMAQSVLNTKYKESHEYNFFYVRDGPMIGFRSASLSFIERVYGRAHSYFEQFTSATSHSLEGDAERGLAILSAIRAELAGGWLFTIKGLVAAELYADFLDQAEHLLNQGYKDAAAVMIGSILEEHLRQLCLKHDVPVSDEKDDKQIPRKADRLNAELAKKAVFTALDSKQITAWLGLRNDAAHGKYDQFTREQVKNLLSGVLEFMARVAP